MLSFYFQRLEEEAEKREEEERLRQLEEERIRQEQEEREEELRKKREKKKKRKNKKRNEGKEELEEPMVTVGPRDIRPTTLAPVMSREMDEPKPSKSSEMVTIRRHPTAPDTTVTISVKSETGNEDLLYTLVNGQGTLIFITPSLIPIAIITFPCCFLNCVHLCWERRTCWTEFGISITVDSNQLIGTGVVQNQNSLSILLADASNYCYPRFFLRTPIILILKMSN